jgi:hypothetical protein
VLDGANTEIDTANRILQQDRLRRGEITGPALALHSTMTRRTWSLHEGDEGSFLAPWSDPCAGLYVANGTRARVEKIDHEKRTVKLRLVDDGQTVMVPMPEKADEQLFGLTYAVHAQRLQGGEAPIILAAPGKYTTSLEAGYSQLTRCVEEVHVYVDRETHGADPTLGLTKAWRASKPKVSASARLREAGHTPDPGFLPVEELALSDTPPLGRLAGPGDGPDVLRLQHADRSFGLGLELAIPC